MKIIAFIFLLPVVLAAYDNDLNQPNKDKYQLHDDCEAALHKQIDEEMYASLMYAAMAAHFDHNSIARKGLATFFEENSKEEREHAQKFINYINRRGGRFSNFAIKMPGKYSWNSALEALSEAVNLEKHVNNKLHHLHDIAARKCVDQHLMDYIEGEFFTEQVESIDQLQRYVSILKGMDTKMGEYLFDRQLQGEKTEL